MRKMKLTAFAVLALWSIAVTAFATSVSKTPSMHSHSHHYAPDDSSCDNGDDGDDGGE